ncbi:MAG: hypothetical protein A3F63_10645 [Pseudomonadales bacterium RIFCSPHIGHO2_12_FULL_40_16]|nr:MAG: hypothetical protein A3F63_10645 [Pseudomonadales bacterium RIFCSPHIGHO2_12_FULL_40_16]HLB42681.1 PaaI family thioesterase [Gammaproteobacteria bacterium]
MEQIDQHDPFAELLGIEITESCFEKAVAVVHIQPEFCNAMGTVHGGIIFSLADISFAAACNSSANQYIGLQTEIRYMDQARGNQLIAEAVLIKASKKFAHFQVSIRDNLENDVALFTGTAYKLESKTQ